MHFDFTHQIFIIPVVYPLFYHNLFACLHRIHLCLQLVGSNFELDGAQQGNERNNNFAGNVAINYLLSKDGKYRLRLYRKNEYFGAVEGYIIETGLKFIITLDYEKFAEILRRKQMVQNGKRETAKKEDNEAN